MVYPLEIAKSPKAEIQGVTYPDPNSVNALRMAQVKKVEPYYPKENYQPIFEDADISTKRTKVGDEIDVQVASFTADAVVNGITDAKWNKYLDILKQLKVDEYTQMWQGYYDKIK